MFVCNSNTFQITYISIRSAIISLQGYNKWNNNEVEQWKGSSRKQSYSYLIQSNSTVSFTWTFQRTEEFNVVSHMLHIAAVRGGLPPSDHFKEYLTVVSHSHLNWLDDTCYLTSVIHHSLWPLWRKSYGCMKPDKITLIGSSLPIKH